MPIAMTPHRAEENHEDRNRETPSEKQWLQDVVYKGYDDAPNHEGHGLSRTRSGKDIDHEGDQCRASKLKQSGNEEHQRPQARSRESHHQETDAGKQRLNYRHTQDASGNAANRGPGERFKLLGPVAEKTNCELSRSFRTLAGVAEPFSSLVARRFGGGEGGTLRKTALSLWGTRLSRGSRGRQCGHPYVIAFLREDDDSDTKNRRSSGPHAPATWRQLKR